MTASTITDDPKAPRRWPSIDEVLNRVQGRDLDILQSLYVARSITTRQIAAAFFSHDWSHFPKGGLGNACERRLSLLATWGLITITLTDGKLISGWEQTPLSGPLCPWGRAVTITTRGIKLLLDQGRLPEVSEVADGAKTVRFKTASKIAPKRSSHKHTFLTSGAVLRAIHANASVYKWAGSRDIEMTNSRRSKRGGHDPVVPDSLIQTEHMSWAIEGDKGSIHVPTLLARWQKAIPIWAKQMDQGVLLPAHYGPSPRVAGVLWYCAASYPVALRNRVRRIRAEAVDPQLGILIPHGLSWYVDSFDGLAWTFQHFLAPWSEGVGLHPQELLERRVASVAGNKHSFKLIAALGDLGAWQKVQVWITEAKMSRQHSPLIVLVRDGVEAQQLWELAVAHDPTGTIVKRMSFLLPPLTDPVARLDANMLVWKPEPDGSWGDTNLKEVQAAYKRVKG